MNLLTEKYCFMTDKVNFNLKIMVICVRILSFLKFVHSLCFFIVNVMLKLILLVILIILIILIIFSIIIELKLYCLILFIYLYYSYYSYYNCFYCFIVDFNYSYYFLMVIVYIVLHCLNSNLDNSFDDTFCFLIMYLN